MKRLTAFAAALLLTAALHAQTQWVNPFIGTSNFGACNPGAVVPNGMMSVSPFNVMGSQLNTWDKDSRWWSTPYVAENSFFTGFTHVNLSGVGGYDSWGSRPEPSRTLWSNQNRAFGFTLVPAKAVKPEKAIRYAY